MALRIYEGQPRVSPAIESGTGDDAIGFVLNGETFACVLPECPAWAKAQLGSGGWRTADQLIGFIAATLVPEDEPRFEDVLRDKDTIVGVNTLAAIVDDIVEQYAGRPFPSPASSANGPHGGGPSSTDASPSPASTPAT